MFEHFTFGLPARPDPEGHSIREVSPTDTASIPRRRTRISIADLITSCAPTSPSPLDDLISKMSDQSVTKDNDISPTSYFHLNTYPHAYPLPSLSPTSSTASSSSSDLSYDEPTSPTSPRRSPSPYSSSSSSSSGSGSGSGMTYAYADRRLQRQLHTQLQCSGAHIRSINALVEQMVASGEQCVTSPPPTMPLNSPGAPLSPCLDNDDDEISLRRAGAPSGIRKTERIAFRGRADLAFKSTGNLRARRSKMRLQGVTVPAVRRKD